MTYSFNRTRRIVSLLLVLLLTVGMFAGCGKTKEEPSVPPSEEQLPPGLVEVKPTETTTPPTEETKPVDKNAAVITTDNTPVRQTPSTDADPIGHLDKGTDVVIIREVSIANVGWSLIREGWVQSDALEKSYVPEPGEDEGIKTPAELAKPDDEKDDEKDTDKDNKDEKPAANNGKGTPGVVTASELNIRKEANQNAERVGGYVYGERVTILETKNGWGRTNKGWISLNYVYQDGAKGANGCNGVVTATQLNVRSGPGTKYDRVDALNFGSRVNVLERITLGDTVWGCTSKGWISMEHVYVDGTKGQGSGEGTCTGNAVNIRSGPGTNYGAVGSADKGDALTIYTQIKIGEVTWGYVAKGNVKGWMSMQYANMG